MKPSNAKSFTLIEVLVACMLIVFISVSFFATLALSFNNLRRVMELRTAALILQEQISIVRELKFSDIQSMDGTFLSGSMSSLNSAAGTVDKSIYKANGKVVKITHSLDWVSFDGRPSHKTIVTLITDHGINKK